MPLRSKPVAIVPIQNRSGTTSYRVTGTIRGTQRKQTFLSLDDAKAAQTVWEFERIHGAAAARGKFTFLTQEELRHAEAAFEILRGTGLTMMDAVRHIIRNPPHKAVEKLFKDALLEFLSARESHLSEAQHENYRIRGQSFAEFVGAKTKLDEIDGDKIAAWLEDKDVGKKTWNNYRGDLFAIFEWFKKRPRRWIAENPVEDVDRYAKRALARAPRQRLEIAACRELMAWLEIEHAEWCTFFALALFAGIRPDMRNGEIFELARCIGRDGAQPYFNNGYLHLSEEITKDTDARQTTIHDNLSRWLTKYPMTKDSVCPADYEVYGQIRKRFKIPHDGLRHTAISAFVAKHDSIALAAQEFGNSETIIRDHYLRRMSRKEADQFYAVAPKDA